MNEKPDISAIFSMLSNNEDLKSKNPEEILAKLMSSNISNSSPSSNTHSPTKTESTTNTDNADKSDVNYEKSFDTNSYSNSMPDMEMMMKLMKVMKSSNENNPSKDLLNSLKPFLNDSRKEKVDQYIKILGITKALETFNDLGDNLK